MRVATLCLVAAAAYITEATYDLNEALGEFLEHYEWMNADAIFIVAILLPIAALLFRNNDLKKESIIARTAEDYAFNLAFHDPLTGLGNRRKLEEALAEVPAGETRAVLVMDLDDFKPINDVFGHATGDLVLKEAAHRLKLACGKEAQLCRIGGDEFAVLSHVAADTQLADSLARQIAAVFDGPFHIRNQEFRVLMSIGISLYRAGAMQPSDAIREADLALYRAKQDHQVDYKLFEKQMEDEVLRRSLLERKLRKAIETGSVKPFFQPLVNLKTSEVVGFEALARWSDPELGVISPAEFIGLAEDSGLISELSDYLLKAACQEAVKWPRHLKLSVNLSPKQLKDKLIGLKILSILGETGLSPTRLEVEITESSLVEDKERARSLLTNLRRAGVRIAIDDFGTGYSSLYHLKEFKFDNLKIDRSFIMAMERGSENEVIVEAILRLSRGLGLVATAEGIEREDQLSQLLDSGCQQGQGYLFGKAISGDDVLQLINELAPEGNVA